MNLNNVEEVGTKFPHVQSRKMQILEEENDSNVQQKFNISTCSVCNKDATVKYISCSECHIQIHYRCTFLSSYQLYYFVGKRSKYRYINCTPTGLVDLSSDGVNVLINDIKEHLVDIETSKRCKQNFPKQTESQLKILRKSTD